MNIYAAGTVFALSLGGIHKIDMGQNVSYFKKETVENSAINVSHSLSKVVPKSRTLTSCQL